MTNYEKVGYYLLGPLHRKPVWDRGWRGGRAQQQGWTSNNSQFRNPPQDDAQSVRYLLTLISYLISLISYLLSFISYLILSQDGVYVQKNNQWRVQFLHTYSLGTVSWANFDGFLEVFGFFSKMNMESSNLHQCGRRRGNQALCVGRVRIELI